MEYHAPKKDKHNHNERDGNSGQDRRLSVQGFHNLLIGISCRIADAFAFSVHSSYCPHQNAFTLFEFWRVTSPCLHPHGPKASHEYTISTKLSNPLQTCQDPLYEATTAHSFGWPNPIYLAGTVFYWSLKIGKKIKKHSNWFTLCKCSWNLFLGLLFLSFPYAMLAEVVLMLNWI